MLFYTFLPSRPMLISSSLMWEHIENVFCSKGGKMIALEEIYNMDVFCITLVRYKIWLRRECQWLSGSVWGREINFHLLWGGEKVFMATMIHAAFSFMFKGILTVHTASKVFLSLLNQHFAPIILVLNVKIWHFDVKIKKIKQSFTRL